ncbi:MAG: uroporphyrinogen-III synthase [Bacteroidia bacterium]
MTHQAFSLPEHYDWVFFTSRNAVNAFFSQHTKNDSKKYAAVGSGTSKALQVFVKHIHFIGNGETTEVAKQFLNQLTPNEKVLFPISNVSLQTVQKSLPKSSVINVEAYLTEENFTEKIKADTYIFTSPSNVRSFLKHNTLSGAKKIIAIGLSTKNELEAQGIYNISVAHSYSELGLLDGI